MSGVWRTTPVEVTVDLPHGGRWTSLRSGVREWLWTNPDPAVVAQRPDVATDVAFVDAGGVEECFPNVRGPADHGAAWSRPWTGAVASAAVEVPGGLSLERRISATDGGVVADYLITGSPGARVVHAVHALLDLSPAARLEVPGATRMTVLGDGSDPDPDAVARWPSGLDALGPDDGTATCVIVPDCHEVTVVDGDHALTFAWTFPARPDLCSLMLWRNLGGWPEHGPYRSIGIEPMIGRTPDPTVADDAASVSLDAGGRVRWSLQVTAAVR